jgi:hypothetical protein
VRVVSLIAVHKPPCCITLGPNDRAAPCPHAPLPEGFQGVATRGCAPRADGAGRGCWAAARAGGAP